METRINGNSALGATIILPPGSTSGELQAAINSAASGDVIEITDDMTFSSAVNVPSGLAIIILSAGSNRVMMQTVAGVRHFTVNGSLTLRNITLHGGNVGGGVQVNTGGGFIMNDGAVIQFCTAAFGGGGVLVNNGGSFTMAGGEITNNEAAAMGGGVLVGNGAVFTLTGGTIRNNEATGEYSGSETGTFGIGSGGGVFVDVNGNLDMTGGMIHSNACAFAGGGIFVGTASNTNITGGGSFIMNGGSIQNNTSLYAGGGVLIRGINTIGTMTSGDITGNRALYYGGGVYVISGTFVMGDAGGRRSGIPVIRNNEAYGTGSYQGQGGGVYIYSYRTAGENGVFTMYDGEISGNRATTLGGGVSIYSGTFTMEGGVIGGPNAADANLAGTSGGGVLLWNPDSTFIMNGGEIIANQATNNGGGVYVYSTSSTDESHFIMTGGEIRGNLANTRNGGGVFITDTGVFIMTGGEIDGNSAPSGNGGGIYVTSLGSVGISGSSFIRNNSAPNGDGGGIYTADYTDYNALTEFDYQNLTTAATVVFSGNSASQAYQPPAIAASYTNIQYATTSIRVAGGYIHPINNYDINFAGGEPLILYHVIYDANGGIGRYRGPDVVAGGTDIILSPEQTSISRAGYTFTGWNTSPDGTGTSYQPGDVITLFSNVTLYAQWILTEIPTKPPVHAICCIPCCKHCFPLCDPCCNAVCSNPCKTCNNPCYVPSNCARCCHRGFHRNH